MYKETDEITRAKLGLVLMDRIGVSRDEFSEDDLDALAACCQRQWIDLGPMFRVRADLVAAVEIETIKEQRPARVGMEVVVLEDEVLCHVSLEGVSQRLTSRLPTEVACFVFNRLTGREITDEQRAELGLPPARPQ